MITRVSLLLLFFLSPFLNFAQSNNDLIKGIQELMLTHYVFLDKAKETNAHLDKLMAEKYFDTFITGEALAKAVTEQMRVITKDKHLSMVPPRAPQKEETNKKTPFAQNFARYYRPMLNEFKYYENNVGYFDMRYFGGGKRNFKEIDVIMKQLAQADAFIIDMRKNGGGSPRMVQYLCSYFIDEHLLLNSIYTRATDHNEELWTVDVAGKKRPDVPVYILTSSRTFSAAEDFSYTMQSLKRATIIGETTGGGAHPTRYYPLTNGFGIRIPFARSINPITKTNWEGIGVIPNEKVVADEALDKAKALATLGAKAYKNNFFQPLETTLNALVDQKITKEKEEKIFELLDNTVKANMITERDINLLGYDYLLSKKTTAALAIFKSNTLLFPKSANVYDSYAEALAGIDKKELALNNYKEAVKVAMEQKDENLAAFQQNLKRFQENNK